MAVHSIALLELKIFENRTGTPLHVSNFGKGSDDLLQVWADFLQQLQAAGGRATKDRHFVPETVTPQPSQRRVRAELDYGPYGLDRRVREAATGLKTGQVAGHEVASDALRTLLAVPKNGMTALLAVECIGRVSVAGLLSSAFKSYVHDMRVGCRVQMAYLDDAAAWQNFLSGADLKEVSFEYLRPAKNNRAGRPTLETYDVRPLRGEVLPSSWIGGLFASTLKPGDILSVPVSVGTPEDTRIVVEGDGKRRTLSIAGGLPRFTWEIGKDGERPSDGDFYSEAEALVIDRLVEIQADPADG